MTGKLTFKDRGKIVTTYNPAEENGHQAYDILSSAFRTGTITEETFHRCIRAMRREGYEPNEEYFIMLDTAMLGARDRITDGDYEKGLAMEMGIMNDAISNLDSQDKVLRDIRVLTTPRSLA